MSAAPLQARASPAPREQGPHRRLRWRRARPSRSSSVCRSRSWCVKGIETRLTRQGTRPLTASRLGLSMARVASCIARSRCVTRRCLGASKRCPMAEHLHITLFGAVAAALAALACTGGDSPGDTIERSIDAFQATSSYQTAFDVTISGEDVTNKTNGEAAYQAGH